MERNKTPYAVENATAFFKEIVSRSGMGNKSMLTYAIRFSARGVSVMMGGTYISRSMAGMERIDTVTQIGTVGPEVETRLYVLGNSTYTCMKLPEFQCYGMELGAQAAGSGAGTDIVADYGKGLDQSLEENEITQVYSARIAGMDAYCFEMRSRVGGLQSENCFTETGVPAKFAYETEQGSMSMMLLNISTDVSAGDFELPAEPQTLVPTTG